MFEANEQTLESAALHMSYHFAPWDEATVGAPVATISRIAVREAIAAAIEFQQFRRWCDQHRVALVNCKLPHHSLRESGFLESQGFRFIELNYRPEYPDLAAADLGPADEVVVLAASPHDETDIAAIAGEIFEAGRFHDDPMIDPSVGALRYRVWVSNAFRNPRQSIVKCLVDARLAAFFIVERAPPDRVFWSLVGMAPAFSGRGLGASVWRSMMRWHRDAGAKHLSTSISSLNVPVLNLYVKLGFRFPAPVMTFHWSPLGKICGAAQ